MVRLLKRIWEVFIETILVVWGFVYCILLVLLPVASVIWLIKFVGGLL